MRTKLISVAIALLAGVSVWADDVWNYNVYDDCSQNGYKAGYAPAPTDVQAVDLGLPSGIKWASCNVGANKPEDYGNYYAWGEIVPKAKENYWWDTYKYVKDNGSYWSLTKYCFEAKYGDNGFTDNKTTLDPEDDAARMNWGSSWRMPTEAEWEELQENCTWTETTQNGVTGRLVTSKVNGNSIFLPPTGLLDDDGRIFSWGNGYYWSSSSCTYPSYRAKLIYFYNGYQIGYLTYDRFRGLCVRPVCPSAVSSTPASSAESDYFSLTLYADGCESANVIKCNAGQYVNVTAVPDTGRHFVRWSDGNTDNPHMVTVTQDMTLTAEFAQTYSGQCGDNLYWNYAEHTLTISGTGAMYNYGENDIPWLLFRDTTDAVVLEQGITRIGANAFRGCTGFTSITIPNSVTSIGSEAFHGCTGLTSVVWNAKKCGGWSSYSSSPFYSVRDNITSFTFGNEVDSIPYAICDNMKNLQSINIPGSVTHIAESAFYGCSGLTSVTIGNSVTSIGKIAFYNCTGLTSITIPNSVTSIGENAFYNCTGLTSVTIGNSVTSIVENTFYGCSGLTSVTIGNSVTSIGENAFAGCRKLYDIYAYPTEPPVADNTSFANYNVSLYVPCDNLRDYQMDVVFGSFKYIQCIGADEVETINEVTVVPSANDAVFTWPAEEKTSTYTIVISKDGVVFCTLTFNANGQLMGIAFAPASDGTAPNRAAESTISGFRFTVTGLSQGSTYTYSVTAKDADDNMLRNYTGEFTTEGGTPTSVQNATIANLCTENGRIVCDGEFQIFDLLGRNVTKLNGQLNGVYIVKSGDKAQKVVVK